MNTMLSQPFSVDFVPGERFLFENLQKNITFTLNNKIIKKGRLLLYKRVHFYIQFTIMNSLNERENFDVPFPFKLEEHTSDGLLYYDYRLSTLRLKKSPDQIKKISSSYFNKILEISN